MRTLPKYSGVLCGAAAAWLLAASPAGAAITFNLMDGSGLTSLQSSNPALYAEVRGGFQQAAQTWANVFSDTVTLNITIDYQALGAGVLGSTSITHQTLSYSSVRTALVNDAKDASDLTATANLPGGSALSFLTNNSAGTQITDSDTTGGNSYNNKNLYLSNANAKALGLISGTNPGNDASITFSSAFSWDFDRNDGISGGAFDFIGVAAHEIGHALGFDSGVDYVDLFTGNGPNKGQINLQTTATVNTLDLYRYASAGQLDQATGGSPYFSIDGGVTSLASFSTGQYNGNGYQASHWLQGTGGIMDPAVAPGVEKNLTSLDIQALDVIGWDLAIPEPVAAATFALLLIPAAIRRRS